MTQPQPPDPSPPAAPVPLDYAAAPNDPGGVSYMGQMGIGCGVFWLVFLVTATALLAVVSSAASADVKLYVLVGAGATVPLVLAAVSVVAWVRWRWPGLLTGVLIGLFIALLLSGLIVGGIALLPPWP